MSAERLSAADEVVGLPVPQPATARDVELGPAAEAARRALAGFAPAALLSDVSVARAAGVVASGVRRPVAWLRVVLEGLDAFRRLQPGRRLVPLLSEAWSDVGRAERALADFAARLGEVPAAELTRLGLGPKLWFTVNGVAVGWRPLPGAGSNPPTPVALQLAATDRLRTAARALAKAGVTPGELSRLRVSDLGRLVPGAVFVPELLAEPLVVRIGTRRPGLLDGDPWLVFLSNEARVAVVAAVIERYGTGVGEACRHGGERIFADL